ncbi:polysaccharide deacetylase family protein [Sphingomonas sp.]|uniref:polysaccharide deacetylase family protein n=1 Tax=Sphingomonas sp. TaxID=28214 RepID=UPI0025D27343|nr:polysaccharide deacetylase family protein [Sphingomonas sp.]
MAIHDVAPLHAAAIEELRCALIEIGASEVAMLVVPDFWGESPILPGSAFAARLRDWADEGVEMFLHGYRHRDDCRHPRWIDRVKARGMTAGEGEFLGLTAREARRRIADGRSLVEDVTGKAISGFVAPAWLYGPGALAALSDTGVGMVEDHWRVWDPALDQTLARSPVITWATRTPVRMASSLAVAGLARRVPLPRVVRVAVHPGDVTSRVVLRSITTTVARLARSHAVSRYHDLIADAA